MTNADLVRAEQARLRMLKSYQRMSHAPSFCKRRLGAAAVRFLSQVRSENILMPETVAEMWESYRRRVLPYDAVPSQLIETRRAFYAGAHGLLHVVSRLGEGSEEAGVETLSQLMAETDQFGKDVVEGKA